MSAKTIPETPPGQAPAGEGKGFQSPTEGFRHLLPGGSPIQGKGMGSPAASSPWHPASLGLPSGPPSSPPNRTAPKRKRKSSETGLGINEDSMRARGRLQGKYSDKILLPLAEPDGRKKAGPLSGPASVVSGVLG